MDYPQRKFSVSSRNGTGSARSDLYLRSVKSSNLKFWRKRFSRQHPISLPCLLSEFRQNKNKSQSHYCSISPITLIYTCTYWNSSKCFWTKGVDSRWFLATSQRKRTGEPSLAASAPVPSMKQYPSFSAGSKCLPPSKDSGVACQTWISRNLVRCKKKHEYFLLFVYLSYNKCVSRFFSNPIRLGT